MVPNKRAVYRGVAAFLLTCGLAPGQNIGIRTSRLSIQPRVTGGATVAGEIHVLSTASVSRLAISLNASNHPTITSQGELLITSDSTLKLKATTAAAVTIDASTTLGIQPVADGTIPNGTSSKKWSEVYTVGLKATGTIRSIAGGTIRLENTSGLVFDAGSHLTAQNGNNGLDTTLACTGDTMVRDLTISNGVLTAAACGAHTTGASVTLSCGAGQAVKTLTTTNGIVTAATCGAP